MKTPRIREVGQTNAPRNCEPVVVRIVTPRKDPVEISGGCIDPINITAREAIELAHLLIAAARTLGARE